MDHTPQLSVHNDDLEEAIGLIKEFLTSLDCVTDVKVEDDGSVQFKHKWSAVRYLSETIKQFFKGDYRPGLDVWGALQNYLIEHHIESRLERWD